MKTHLLESPGTPDCQLHILLPFEQALTCDRRCQEDAGLVVVTILTTILFFTFLALLIDEVKKK